MSLPRWVKVLGIFVAGAALALLLLRGWQRTTRADPPIIRSYEVQPEIAREVYGVVDRALQPDNLSPLGGVTLAPGGRLVVTARPEIQAGIARTIGEINARQLPSTPTIAFDLWLVTARPGQARERPLPPELTELASAIEELRKTRGDLQFELLEKLSLMGRSGGEGSQVTGAHVEFRVEPTLRRAEDGTPRITAEMEVDGRRPEAGELKSLVELRPGQLLVIGERSSSGGQPQAARDLYYIVRARL